MEQGSVSEQPLIHVDNVVKTFPTGAGEVTVLRGVTLKVKPGEAVGQGVTIKVGALPELTLKGEVVSIGSLFQEKSGGVTYPVTIELIDTDPQLRWGMTVAMTFEK